MVKPIFKAEDHSYTSPLGKYTSVTTLLHQLEPVKDFNKIAVQYVSKRTPEQLLLELSTKFNLDKNLVQSYLDEFGPIAGTQAIWKLENKRACDDGSAVHLVKENQVLSHKLFKTKENKVIPLGINALYVTDLFSLPDGVYTELLIWNNDLMVSGQADLVIITTDEKTGERFCEIQDYKTNKEIKDYNYINSRTGGAVINEYLNSPLNNYCNCNYWIYQFQLNIYAWMLGKFGFKFNGGTIIHIPDNNKKIPLLNLQDEVTKLMEWRKSLLKK